MQVDEPVAGQQQPEAARPAPTTSEPVMEERTQLPEDARPGMEPDPLKPVKKVDSKLDV